MVIYRHINIVFSSYGSDSTNPKRQIMSKKSSVEELLERVEHWNDVEWYDQVEQHHVQKLAKIVRVQKQMLSAIASGDPKKVDPDFKVYGVTFMYGAQQALDRADEIASGDSDDSDK